MIYAMPTFYSTLCLSYTMPTSYSPRLIYPAFETWRRQVAKMQRGDSRWHHTEEVCVFDVKKNKKKKKSQQMRRELNSISERELHN